MTTATETFAYSPWRHGGWYVDNVRYPSGAVGCVSRNYADRKWRIACDPRGFDGGPGDVTYPNRDAAAAAELELARDRWRAIAELADFGHYPPEVNGRDGRCVMCAFLLRAGDGLIVLGSDKTGTFAAHLHSICADRVREIQAGTRRNPYA